MEENHMNLCDRLGETAKATPNISDRDPLDDAATSNNSQPVESDTENSWKHRLGMLKEKIEKLQDFYDDSYLEIGRLLVQAREIYKGHGNWLKWLNQNVPFSVRHAQRLIRVAEMFDGENATLVSQLGLTSSKVYILARVEKNDIDYFLHTIFPVGDRKKYVSEMTRRELEVVVKNFLKEKLAATNHEDVAASKRGKENMKGCVESNLDELREVLNKTIISIRDSDLNTREAWISELEDLYRTGLDQLTSASE